MAQTQHRLDITDKLLSNLLSTIEKIIMKIGDDLNEGKGVNSIYGTHSENVKKKFNINEKKMFILEKLFSYEKADKLRQIRFLFSGVLYRRKELGK